MFSLRTTFQKDKLITLIQRLIHNIIHNAILKQMGICITISDNNISKDIYPILILSHILFVNII